MRMCRAAADEQEGEGGTRKGRVFVDAASPEKRSMARLNPLLELEAKDRARAEALKREIEDEVAAGAPLREKFAKTAEVHSTCPSAKKGGELGTFKPGQMVKEFDAVVFGGDVGRVLGPVDTQFGSHLILVTDREESS